MFGRLWNRNIGQSLLTSKKCGANFIFYIHQTIKYIDDNMAICQVSTTIFVQSGCELIICVNLYQSWRLLGKGKLLDSTTIQLKMPAWHRLTAAIQHRYMILITILKTANIQKYETSYSIQRPCICWVFIIGQTNSIFSFMKITKISRLIQHHCFDKI